MQITDSLTLDASGLALTRDGYLVGEGRVARAGNVQQYRGSELGLIGEDAERVFGVYRDPEVVFDRDSMLSLAGRPVTRGHPPSGVDADSWRDLAIGQVGGVIRREGEHVIAPMAIMDATAAKEVGAGARALSAGYTCNVIADEGIAPDGTPYQFRQAGPLRFNHVAYLPDNNPRAGNTRIGDGAESWGACPVTSDRKPEKEKIMTLKTVTVDGIPVEVTDQGATVIATLQTRLADATKKITDVEASHTKALADKDTAHAAAIAAKDKELADKDAELAKKDAEIDAAKAKVVDAAALDKLVQARGGLIATARSIAKDVKTDGLTDAEIRKAVVVAVKGEDRVKDKSDAYIDAAFDNLVEDAAKGTHDPVRGVILGGVKTVGDAEAQANDAWAKGLVDLNAWRKEG